MNSITAFNTDQRGKGHLLVTANTSWNILNFRRSLIAALLEDGYRVTVLAPPDAASDALIAMGCGFAPLTMDSKGLSPAADLRLVLRFVQAMRRERPDAVLGFTIKNNVYGAMAARLLRIPFLPNASGLGTGFMSGAWLQMLVERLYRFAFSRVPVAFFQNEEDRNLFVGAGLVPPTSTRCLPGSGVDLRHFAVAGPRDTAGPMTFVLIARLLRDKGVGEFVEAARLVRRHHPETRFQLLGGAGAANRTALDRRIVESWVAEGLVAWLGETGDVRPFIAAADCVVLPSYREGRPRSLIEAAAMGRPCIATDVPGCRDVVEHGRTGLLCRLKDPGDLARQMIALIELGPEGRARMGRSGRLKVERDYDEAIVINAYRRELQAIADGASFVPSGRPERRDRQVAGTPEEA